MLRGAMAARVFLALALISSIYPATLDNSYEACITYRAIRNSLKYTYILNNYVFFVMEGDTVYKSEEVEDPSNITVQGDARKITTMWPALKKVPENFNYTFSIAPQTINFKGITYLNSTKTLTLNINTNTITYDYFTVGNLYNMQKWMFISFENPECSVKNGFFSIEQEKKGGVLYFHQWMVVSRTINGDIDFHPLDNYYYPYFNIETKEIILYKTPNANHGYNFEPLTDWVFRTGFGRNQFFYIIASDYYLKINTIILNKEHYGKKMTYANKSLQSMIWPPCKDENNSVSPDSGSAIDLKTIIMSVVIACLLIIIIYQIVTQPKQAKQSKKPTQPQVVSSKDPNYWLQPSVFSDAGPPAKLPKSYRSSKPKHIPSPVKSPSSGSKSGKISKIASKSSKNGETSQVSNMITTRSGNLSNAQQTRPKSSKK